MARDQGISPDRPSCGFCLQSLDPGAGRPCRRCRALYHPDCWKANDGRCARYGCEPAAKPPVSREPARAWTAPAPSTPFGAGNWGWFVMLISILVTNLNRVSTTSSSAPRPPIPSLTPAPTVNILAERQNARNLLEEARPLLAALKDWRSLETASEREEYRRALALAREKLSASRSALLRSFQTPLPPGDLAALGEIRKGLQDLDRLQPRGEDP